MTLKQFFDGLAGLHQPFEWRDEDVRRKALLDIHRNLSDCHLESDQLLRLYNHILDNFAFHPMWADIYQAVQQLGVKRIRNTNPAHFLLFDLDGHRKCVKVPDPSILPKLPDGATNIHLAIDRAEEWYRDAEAHDTGEITNKLAEILKFPKE